MKLLPSLKQKKRYLLFKLISAEQKFKLPEVESEVNQALLLFLGQIGVAKAAPIFLKEKFDFDQQQFVVKVDPKFVNEVKAALTLIKKIKNSKVIIHSIITSGTIKKLKKRN